MLDVVKLLKLVNRDKNAGAGENGRMKAAVLGTVRMSESIAIESHEYSKEIGKEKGDIGRPP
jgi:hypothetical protein